MARVLLITWDGSGTFAPQRALINLLATRGHCITVLGHSTQKKDCLRDGFSFLCYPSLPEWNDSDPKQTHKSIKEIVEAEECGLDALRCIEYLKPDVVLVDFFLRSAIKAAYRAGVPIIALGPVTFTSIKSSDLPSVLELADRILMFSDPLLEAEVPTSSKYIYVGQLRPHTFDRTRPILWSQNKKRITVSFSTGFQSQHETISRICDAMRSLPVDCLVTTGKSISPSHFHPSKNITIRRHVSHDDVLPASDLFINHAGHGSLFAGAAYGIPMICVPMGRDQHSNSSKALQLGISRVCAAESSALNFQASIIAALEDGSLFRNVRRVSRLLQSRQGAKLAIEIVEEMSRRREIRSARKPRMFSKREHRPQNS